MATIPKAAALSEVVDKDLIAIDLFSGCGGLTQGLRDAGFRVIAAVDNDQLSVATYKRNHPGVYVWQEDIRRLSVAKVGRLLKLQKGELDLLAGCPPCQAFSAMRRLNGRRRVRDKVTKDLVFEFLRFVEGLLPKSVMMENVPRLAKDDRMRKFRKRLKDLGYVGKDAVLNVADFGVPQRRRRMVYIGSRVSQVAFAEPISKNERTTVWETINHLPIPGGSGDALHDILENRSGQVLARIRRIPRDGGSRKALGEDDQLPCHKRSEGFNDVYGRMAWDDVSPTITGGCINPSKGRFLHPEQDRAITLREAALLQSFPPNYEFPLDRGKYAVARMIGNALPPEFVRQHARGLWRKLLEHQATA